jgi:hypothetical protein
VVNELGMGTSCVLMGREALTNGMEDNCKLTTAFFIYIPPLSAIVSKQTGISSGLLRVLGR